jgi:hypothetical protein
MENISAFGTQCVNDRRSLLIIAFREQIVFASSSPLSHLSIIYLIRSITLKNKLTFQSFLVSLSVNQIPSQQKTSVQTGRTSQTWLFPFSSHRFIDQLQ